MATLKNIQDALIARIRGQVSALNSRTVKPWTGTIEEFFEEGKNTPFCGVYFQGSDPSTEVVDNSATREDYTWLLTIITTDRRGMEYSNEDALELIDDIRTALIGHTLSGQSGVAPLTIGPISPVEEETERSVTAYEMEIYTWQIQQ